MSRVNLSPATKRIIRATADTLPIPPDAKLVATLTGFTVRQVRDALNLVRFRPKKRKPITGKPISTKPVFVQEVEATAGLEAQFYRNLGDGVSEWLLLSPTRCAVAIFHGRDDICQGVSNPGAARLQGISSTQREERKNSKQLRKDVPDVLR